MLDLMRPALLALPLLLPGCVAEPLPADPASAPVGWAYGELVTCDAPGDAFAVLEDQAVARGVDREIPPGSDFGLPGHYLVGVLAHDVDGDGDVDLAFNRPDASLDLYVNDGFGAFTFAAALPSVAGIPDYEPLWQGFVDIDGDGLPELLETSFFGLTMRRAESALVWGEAIPVWDARGTQYEWAAWSSFAAGDLDLDGDLDVVLASVHGQFDPFNGEDEPPPGEAELILFGDGAGGFEEPVRLVSNEGPGMSQMILLTDRDVDGDLDIFVGADLLGPAFPSATLFDNQGRAGNGELRLLDIGYDTNAMIDASHMGADSADLNGDGLLDYCFSDVGPLVCLETDGQGGFVDTRAARGIVPASMDSPSYWTGWSLEMADLDNDGLEDLVVAAGRVDDFIESEDAEDRPWESDQPNGIWRATAPGQWEERTDALAFGSIRESFGLATADLDGDGALEVIIGNELGTPSIWQNRCSDGAWITVDLDGLPGNVDGYGAMVTVTDGDARWMQEVYSLRTMAHGPPQLHFGLGARDTVAQIAVRWPGGVTSTALNVPTRRRITVTHPDAG